jgi:ferrous iron transport protein B
MRTLSKDTYRSPGVIAICGNPNCGKTTIFNAITGLNQQVGNYPGVTVEKVSGRFSVSSVPDRHFTLIDVPGSYSLSAFTPDEHIAATVLFGELKGEPSPDAVICVVDATQLERSFYLLLQTLQIGCPVVVAVNMVDLAQGDGTRINFKRLSRVLGGIPVVPVIGNRRKGVERLKIEAARAVGRSVTVTPGLRCRETDELIEELAGQFGGNHHSRAQYMRIIFDEDGPAEREFRGKAPLLAVRALEDGRVRLRKKYGSLILAETQPLTERAGELFRGTVRRGLSSQATLTERVDRYLLHPVLGPIVLVLLMILVFQSIFSWAAPFMDIIDKAFSSLAGVVKGSLGTGPLRSLLGDGVIGGVGSVLVFIPQITILFMFIALLEDSGYMPRAAFLVDRMFRWCGLSGKSFIPMLSSFACAIPGILATRTIEDRKLRLITIMVAPLMTCSARLPVYAIMIAAFVPYKTYLGVFNLQGLVLTMLYLLGIVAAVMVSFILKKTLFKTERGTFMMEMPSYKMPTFRSLGIRVVNRVKAFIVRAGTIILAITIIIWGLSYYPGSEEVAKAYMGQEAAAIDRYELDQGAVEARLHSLLAERLETVHYAADVMASRLNGAINISRLDTLRLQLVDEYPDQLDLVVLHYELGRLRLAHEITMTQLANDRAGEQIRRSYLAMAGHRLEPFFEPLGWDWKITVSVLAAFPAREVVIATLATIYNLGTEVSEESSSLVDKMRRAEWEEGSRKGRPVFTPAVALSIMVFFALCCQCGATLVTIRQETSRWFYSMLTFAYMSALAYLSAMAVYQLMVRAGLG